MKTNLPRLFIDLVLSKNKFYRYYLIYKLLNKVLFKRTVKQKPLRKATSKGRIFDQNGVPQD